MKKHATLKRASTVPKDAVLLIPEPEGELAPYGIKPGYYNLRKMLRLIEEQKRNADAIQFIADMLETGNAEHDGFVTILRASHSDSAAITRIIQICKKAGKP